MTQGDKTHAPLHFILPEPASIRRLWRCRRRASETAALYPGATWRIWHGSELREQINRGSGANVADAFDALPSPLDRMRLASWCLLHQFGGLFHAPGLRLMTPLPIPQAAGAAGFNDLTASASGWSAISPDLLWSRAGRREWELAIDIKIETGRHSSGRAPTDEAILGMAFGATVAEQGERGDDDQWVGQAIPVLGPSGARNKALVAPDGTMVALIEAPT